MADSKLLKDIKAEIEDIADRLGIEPYALNKAQFKEFSKVSEWDLKKLGGYQTILTTYFPAPDKQLKDIELNKQRKSYISKLEKKYGTWEAFAEQLTNSLVEKLDQMKVEPVILNEKATKAYLKSVAKPTLHDTTSRSVVIALTDLHFGTNVDEAELGGKNKFD